MDTKHTKKAKGTKELETRPSGSKAIEALARSQDAERLMFLEIRICRLGLRMVFHLTLKFLARRVVALRVLRAPS